MRNALVVGLSVILACGSPADEHVDAGGIPADAPHVGSGETIRVTVFSHDHPGQPFEGALVYFESPAHVVTTVSTDANGVAEAVCEPDTRVTAVQTSVHEPYTFFSSFRSLQPGDAVVSGPRHRVPTIAGSSTITFPEYPGGRFYTVSSSCPFSAAILDINKPNVARFDFEGPCSTATSATLVGRVKDVDNHLLAVSILDDVDLAGASGGTITMPAFDVVPEPLTATLTNVPYPVDWAIGFAAGSDARLLEFGSIASSEINSVDLATTGYPAGDQTAFVLWMLVPNLLGTFSAYRDYKPMRVNHEDFDASSFVKSVVMASETVDADSVHWSETPEGRNPSTVVAVITSHVSRGVVYGPYDGTDLSLDELSFEVFANHIVSPVELLYFDVPGVSYQDTVGLFEETITLQKPTVVRLPSTTSYWMSSSPLDLPPPFFGAR